MNCVGVARLGASGQPHRNVRVAAAATSVTAGPPKMWPSTPTAAIIGDKFPFRMSTQPDCALGIGLLPDFAYNGAGGVSFGTATFLGDSEWKVEFDTAHSFVPPLNFSTTSIMGVPFPPIWQIIVKPVMLEGTLNTETGIVELEYDSVFDLQVQGFDFGLGTQQLSVKTNLTTERSAGDVRQATGERLVYGRCKMVGVSKVPKIDNPLVDTLLQLPTDALAVLSAQMEFMPKL